MNFAQRLIHRLKHSPNKLAVLRGAWCRWFHRPVFVGHPSAGKYLKTPVECIRCGHKWEEWEINNCEISFEWYLKNEFLTNTQDYPKEYFDLFQKKFKRALNAYESRNNKNKNAD